MHARVGVEMTQMTTAAQLQAVADGRLHVGFISPAGRQATLMIGSRELRIHTVLREPLMVALPRSHRLAGQKVIHLKSLAEEKFILGPRSTGAGYHDRVVSLCHQSGFEPTIAVEASPSPLMLTFVSAELGVALVPRCSARFTGPDVILRPLRQRAEVELAAVWWSVNPAPVLPGFLALLPGQPTRGTGGRAARPS